MARPDVTLLPVEDAVQRLATWIAPQLPPKLVLSNEKISDAQLIAVAMLRFLHKLPYFSRWWSFLKINFFPHFSSLTQAVVRLARLTPVVERIAVRVEHLDFSVIDSEPMPVCRSNRAAHCKVRGATFGYGSQGSVYGFKLLTWTKLNGQIALYTVRPANLHDLGHELNDHWAVYGTPKLIGDKAYQDGVYLTPPKKNAKTLDPRWKGEYAAARKIIETTFSSLVRAGLRFAQVKTFRSLRLRVDLAVLAHNFPFFNP